MTSVADDETDVVLAGEIDGGHDISRGRDIDSIVDVVAELTRARRSGPRVTALVGEEGLHDRGGGLQVRLGQGPVGLEGGTGSRIVGRRMAGSANGYGSDETTADGVVECGPGGGGGPTPVPGQTVTLISDRSGGQSPQGYQPSLHDSCGEGAG